MLDEYKEMYRQKADAIENWRNLSKNELCNRYISVDDTHIKDAYLSAILYRYWGLITKFYNMSSNVATPEDCYEWLVDSVMCAVNCKRWTEEDSTIYKDPNGPDKVINRAMKCARLNFYQFINRKKRKDNFGLLSLDALKDNLNDNTYDIEDPDASIEDDINPDINQYIKRVFNKKDYFQAFMLDCIMFDHPFELREGKSVFSLKKLSKTMRELGQNYTTRFAKTYDLPLSKVASALNYCTAVNPNAVASKIEYNLQKLKHDHLLSEVLLNAD